MGIREKLKKRRRRRKQEEKEKKEKIGNWTGEFDMEGKCVKIYRGIREKLEEEKENNAWGTEQTNR